MSGREFSFAFTLMAIQLVQAQKAPDFTVTDFNNKTHRLYEDYLNQNKVVVLKFFFVGCPPCANIAPYVEQAYQRWGAGAGKTEFLEISTLSSDKNNTIKSYHQSKGLSFPGIGSDGGAQAALQPYKSGTFGTWYGTPTFVVIAPDGTVEYNVNMSLGNPYGLDTAIARAFRSTGGGGCPNAFSVKTVTQLQPDTYFLIDYQNGNPTRELSSGAYNCEFNLPADLSGLYVVPQFNLTENPVDRISLADVVRIQKYILQLQTFNKLQVKLADVNNSWSITTADVAEIRKLILGVSTGFKKLPGQFEVVYDPGSKNLTTIDNKVSLESLLASPAAVNEFGIGKYGDVSGAEMFRDQVPVDRGQSANGIEVLTEALPGGFLRSTFFAEEPSLLEGVQLGLPIQNAHIVDLKSASSCFETEWAVSPESRELRVLLENNFSCSEPLPSKSALFTVMFKDPHFPGWRLSDQFHQEMVYANGSTVTSFSLKPQGLENRVQREVWVNLVHGKVLIQSPQLLSGAMLFDLQGKTLQSSQPLTGNVCEIPVSGISPGIYALKIQYADGIATARMLSIVEPD
ncbi:MAG: redoxin domain-containing protein [Saprospiraceae bacterium]|nr:redoxin domain-containing protein [Saprospiraceae bacterium]